MKKETKIINFIDTNPIKKEVKWKTDKVKIENENLKQNEVQTRQWLISVYKHDKIAFWSLRYLSDWGKKLINISFSHFYIGKQIFKYYNKKVVIIIYLYNGKKTKDDFILSPLFMKLLQSYLEKVLNLKVELRIIKMRFPYLNAEILAKYLSLRCLKKSFSSVQRKLYIKMKKARFHHLNFKKVLKSNQNKIFTNRLEYLEKLSFKHLLGIKLQLKGRLSRRRTAERTIKRSSYKGSLKNIKSSTFNEKLIPIRNHFKSNIDFAQSTRKNKNGAFTLKVWLSGGSSSTDRSQIGPASTLGVGNS